MVIFLALALLFGQEPADAAKFRALAAEFDARTATVQRAASADSRAVALLDWLRALNDVLKAIPFERTAGPHEEWIRKHDALIIYSEPAGQWLIGKDVFDRVYAEHAKSAVADEIAWLAASNGLPGECEGYVPCYAGSLNMLEGEYLRRQPGGAHRAEAFARITEVMRIVLEDLLKRPDRNDFLSVPRDCPDLLQTAVPLRNAIGAARDGTKTEALALSNRLVSLCGNR